MSVRVELEPKPVPSEEEPPLLQHFSIRFGRFGAAATVLKAGAPQPAELGFHVAYLDKARAVSEPEFKKVATLAGSLRLEKPGALPVFVCDPERDFAYEEPEPDPDEPVRRMLIEYPLGIFETPPAKDAPATKLRLPKEPEGSRFLEIVCDLAIGGADEAGLDVNGRFDTLIGPIEALITDMPLTQLKGVAEIMGPRDFIAWMTHTFGHDIPHRAYASLLGFLQAGTLRMPKIEIVASLPNGNAAGYDKSTRSIKIKRGFIRDAETDEEQSGLLMMALVEEYGHAIDDLLRTRLSATGGDAAFDEGALFAYSIVNFGWDLRVNGEYAEYLREGETVPLSVRWEAYKDRIDAVLGPEEQRKDDMEGAIEFFGAGEGHGKPGTSFGHESIEDTLLKIFNPTEKEEIYFGNWLRDYSQVITPVTLGILKHAELADPRRVMTDILDVYARAKFADLPHFQVTTARLGVYRSDEHIDNPDGLKTSSLDSGLDPAPIKDQLAIDGASQRAHYIFKTFPPPATPGLPARRSGAQYMRSQFIAASFAKDTPEGRRCLGQALHTLEDFYAHTNFCELALRVAGKKVEPWTPTVTVGGKTFLPLVSGMFGGLDTAVSILLAIGEILTDKNDPCKAGERTLGAKIALIILRARAQHLATQAEGALKMLEDAERAVPWIGQVTCQMRKYMTWTSFLIGAMIRLIINQIDEGQAVANGPPTTSPTHTQLAKDHDDHPLHVLAANCAQVAVRDIAREMKALWESKPDALAAIQIADVAESYLVHPELITPTSRPGLIEIQGLIKKFADDPKNAAAIAKASTRTPNLDELKKAKEFGEKLTRGIPLERLRQIFGL